MRSPPSFVRMVARATFVVVFITILLLPGLTAPQPKPHFAALRHTLDTLPLVNIGATAAVGLVLLRVGRHWRTRQQTRQTLFRPRFPTINRDLLLERMQTAMQLAQQLSVASIYDAVKLSGGNGLASPPFEIPTGFFGLFSWQHVEEGTEALIIDGKTVRRGDPTLSLWNVFGRRMVGRRVLLRPAPLVDLGATALTTDQLSLTLTVSVQYTVANPQYVSTLERPIDILQQRIIGAIAEYIRTDTLTALLRDDGTLRAVLRERLNEAASIRDGFTIVEVLKALPSGDERFIELSRQVRAAEMKQPLIVLENQNKLMEQSAAQQLKLLDIQLDEQRRDAEHRRRMQQQQAELDAQKFQSMAASLSLATGMGSDPNPLAEVFRQLMQSPGAAIAPPETPTPAALPAPSEPETPAPAEPAPSGSDPS
jgi:hypothetical protein